MAFFCANLEGSLTKIQKISGTTNSQIFLDALFFLPKSQIIDTHFTTVSDQAVLLLKWSPHAHVPWENPGNLKFFKFQFAEKLGWLGLGWVNLDLIF